MAKTKAEKKAAKAKGKSTGLKPIKQKMTKSALIKHITDEVSGDTSNKETKRIVSATIDELINVIMRSIKPGGYGSFSISKTFKVALREKKAIKKGTMVRSPATGGMVPSKGRPASKRVKINPLKLLKEAAEGKL